MGVRYRYGKNQAQEIRIKLLNISCSCVEFVFFHFVSTAIEIMTRLKNITDLKPISRSVTTGKKWSSGADMALEVSEDQDNYMGG